MTRYALYFTPPQDSPWAAAGNQWLGCAMAGGEACAQPHIDGVAASVFAGLTADARRYGFHATLKAPFHLADGFTEAHLLKMAKAFCASQKPVILPEMTIAPYRDFLALQIAIHDDEDDEKSAEINALAERCVDYFDVLRATPSDVELARRRSGGLTPRQEVLLQKWGYPYTEELFCFHMTLSGALGQFDVQTVEAIRAAAQRQFAPAIAQEPLTVDGLTILREEYPGAPFVEWKRFNFTSQQASAALPTPGRLFFCVGPRAVDKDALLDWTQKHLSNQHRFVFAQCVSMRPPHAFGTQTREALTPIKEQGLACDTVDFTTFWQIATEGQFAMVWQANDLYYGIRRGIEADLKAGCDVVVNGARAYVPQLRRTFPNAIVVWIDAQESASRDRSEIRLEKGPALLKQLHRTTSIFTPPDDPNVIQLDSSGSLELAGRRLLGLLASAPHHLN